MLYMVIESFRDLRPVSERFQQSGRMLPDGLIYHASWMEQSGRRCFQLMETSQPELLDVWMSRWQDLMDFEVTPVATSADFWARYRSD